MCSSNASTLSFSSESSASAAGAAGEADAAWGDAAGAAEPSSLAPLLPDDASSDAGFLDASELTGGESSETASGEGGGRSRMIQRCSPRPPPGRGCPPATPPTTTTYTLAREDIAVLIQQVQNVLLGVVAALHIIEAHGLKLDDIGPRPRVHRAVVDHRLQDAAVVPLRVDDQHLHAADAQQPRQVRVAQGLRCDGLHSDADAVFLLQLRTEILEPGVLVPDAGHVAQVGDVVLPSLLLRWGNPREAFAVLLRGDGEDGNLW